MDFTPIRSLAEEIGAECGKVIIGKGEQIRLVLTSLFAGGHVLIDDIEDGMLLCRSQAEAPDIDPYVIVPAADVSGYEIGQELDVEISDVHEYDLIGSLV